MHRMIYGILQPLAAVAVRSEDELSWTIAVRLKFFVERARIRVHGQDVG
jgi:hypothetical protein